MKSLFTIALLSAVVYCGAQTELLPGTPGESASLAQSGDFGILAIPRKPGNFTKPRNLTNTSSLTKPVNFALSGNFDILAIPLKTGNFTNPGNLTNTGNLTNPCNLAKPFSLIKPGSLSNPDKWSIPVKPVEPIRRDKLFTGINWKSTAVSASLLMISGFADGTSETLKVKYHTFEKVFPGEDDQFWDYNISWINKYKNGTPPTPAFPGSKGAFVWTTDGYHMMRMIRNSTMVIALVVHIRSGAHREFRYFLMEAVIHYLAYTTGFNLAYSVVFKE